MHAPAPKNLKLSHLRLIAAIAEHGQLSLAAAALSMTQSAGSRLLAEIEQNIGARVCERHAKGVELTLIGQVLARRAHNMQIELRDLAREIDELHRGGGGTARVGAVTGAAVGYLVPAVLALRAASAGAEIYVDVAPSEALARDLLAGTTDFVLGRIPPQMDARRFEAAPARTEVVEFVVRRDHPLAAADGLSIAALAGYEWVMPAAGAPIRAAVERAFLASGAEIPRSVTVTTSLLVMIAMLSASTAIAPIAREVATLLIEPPFGAGLAVLPVRDRIEVAPYYLLTVRGRQLSPLADRLRALVAAEFARPDPPRGAGDEHRARFPALHPALLAALRRAAGAGGR